PGLHLDDDERAPVLGEDVDLALPAAPVPGEDPHALRPEVLLGDPLAVPAQPILRGHRTTSGSERSPIGAGPRVAECRSVDNLSEPGAVDERLSLGRWTTC